MTDFNKHVIMGRHSVRLLDYSGRHSMSLSNFEATFKPKPFGKHSYYRGRFNSSVLFGTVLLTLIIPSMLIVNHINAHSHSVPRANITSMNDAVTVSRSFSREPLKHKNVKNVENVENSGVLTDDDALKQLKMVKISKHSRSVLEQEVNNLSNTIGNDDSKWESNSLNNVKTVLNNAKQTLGLDEYNADASKTWDSMTESVRMAASSLKPAPPKPAPVAKPVESTKLQMIVATPANEMQQWLLDDLKSKGFTVDDYNAANTIITRESGWRVDATNASSGAYGLPQALPGNKMGSMGADWQTNYQTQLRWFENYCINRYGGFVQALNAWNTKGWY